MNTEQIEKYFQNPPITPLIEIKENLFKEKSVKLFLKREDLIHPHISGNKWFKLKYNLIEAKKQGFNQLLSFGGAYSNHIYALAAAGKEFNFKTIGVIRGEEYKKLNPTLAFAKKCGMKFIYINRIDYRDKYNKKLLNQLREQFGEFYLIPEGGSNKLAVKGCKELVNRIDIDYNYICCACGTAGTISGIIEGLNGKNFALGFSALKNADFLYDEISKLSERKYLNWEINLEYHSGGYAKFNNNLLDFVKRFERNHNIPLEPIYTGKMLFGIYDLIEKNYFSQNSVIVAIHSGGLQGLEGLKQSQLI